MNFQTCENCRFLARIQSNYMEYLSTPENIDRVSTWMQEAGLDASKVYTFESFLDKYKRHLG